MVATFLGPCFYVSVEGADSQSEPECPRVVALRDHLNTDEEDVLLVFYADDSAYFVSYYQQIVATNKICNNSWICFWRG